MTAIIVYSIRIVTLRQTAAPEKMEDDWDHALASQARPKSADQVFRVLIRFKEGVRWLAKGELIRRAR